MSNRDLAKEILINKLLETSPNLLDMMEDLVSNTPMSEIFNKYPDANPQSIRNLKSRYKKYLKVFSERKE